MDLCLKDKSVLVTGGSKGIGAAIAEAFAAEGCRHIHIASRDRERLAATAAQIHSRHGATVDIHPTDLRDGAQLARLAEACAGVDILVNNAGDIPGGTIDKIDGARWRHAWDLKVFGTIDLTRLIYARMKERRSGVIVNIIGTAGERFPAGYIAGATGNAALMGFTRALGGSSLDDNVRVLAINPSSTETERAITLARQNAANTLGDAERYRELMTGFPGGRMARPSEVADLAVFLASPRASYISGSVHTIDGGHQAGRKQG